MDVKIKQVPAAVFYGTIVASQIDEDILLVTGLHRSPEMPIDMLMNGLILHYSFTERLMKNKIIFAANKVMKDCS